MKNLTGNGECGVRNGGGAECGGNGDRETDRLLRTTGKGGRAIFARPALLSDRHLGELRVGEILVQPTMTLVAQVDCFEGIEVRHRAWRNASPFSITLLFWKQMVLCDFAKLVATSANALNPHWVHKLALQ